MIAEAQNVMMLHLQRTWSTSAFSFSVFYHSAVLLLLTQSCGGQFQVVGPVQPVTVMIGEDVILPCHLKPAVDAAAMTFEWARPDLNPRFVHVWHGGQDLHVNQNPSYKGRTSVSINKLKDGDVSLTLSKVKLSDNGLYRCYFPDEHKDSTVQLVVGMASSPIVSLSGIDRSSSGVILQCESEGWYPEPEVSWLDDDGHVLSAGPTETVRGPDGLYTVSSRVTVEKRHRNSFTCRVQQKDINQSRETQIHVPDDFFMVPSSSAACTTISVIACFISVLAVVFAVWQVKRNKIKKGSTETNTTSSTEEKRLMAENEKIKDTEKKMAETLHRKEEEHKAMFDALMEQKKEIKNQRDQRKVEKKEVEDLVENIEEMFESVEKDVKEKDGNKTCCSTQGYMKLKEPITKFKWNLTERDKELDKLEIVTDKLLEITGRLIGRTEKIEADTNTQV